MKGGKLIIDGSNLLYRSFYSQKSRQDSSKRDNYHIFIFLVVLRKYVNTFRPDEIIVCWEKPLSDENRVTKKRVLLYEGYKSQRVKIDNVYTYFLSLVDILNSLGVRQVFPHTGECDDALYWLCAVKYPNQCTLVSTDSDMYQLIRDDLSHNIIYDPRRKMEMTKSFLQIEYDVNDGFEYIIKKCFRGDTSDNIYGCKGMRSKKIKEVIEFINDTKDDLEINFEALESSNLLKDNELEIFKRNVKLMKLDEICKDVDEIKLYEGSLLEDVEQKPCEFKNMMRVCEFWNIFRYSDEWINDFRNNKASGIEYNDYYELFE